MPTAPYLIVDKEGLKLNAAVGGTRRNLILTDRAEVLLIDDLGYGRTDFVPIVTVKALVLAGGIRIPTDCDVHNAAWDITCAEGGRDATDDECYRVAEYIRAVDIPQRNIEILREHVRATRLWRYLTDEEITTTENRVVDLSDIARGL